MNLIRKIIVGPDIKNGMQFTVGQELMGGSHTVYNIEPSDAGFIVWLKNDRDEVYQWKEFLRTMPISIEYNIEL